MTPPCRVTRGPQLLGCAGGEGSWARLDRQVGKGIVSTPGMAGCRTVAGT